MCLTYRKCSSMIIIRPQPSWSTWSWPYIKTKDSLSLLIVMGTYLLSASYRPGSDRKDRTLAALKSWGSKSWLMGWWLSHLQLLHSLTWLTRVCSPTHVSITISAKTSKLVILSALLSSRKPTVIRGFLRWQTVEKCYLSMPRSHRSLNRWNVN